MNATLNLMQTMDLLTDGQLREHQLASKQANVSLEKELITSGVISADQMYEALSSTFGYLYIKAYYGVKLDAPTASKFKSKDFSSQRFIPIILKDSTYILVCDAEQPARDTRISTTVGEDVRWALCSEDIMDTLQNKLVVPLEMEDLAEESVDTTADNNNEVQELARTGQKVPDMLAMIVQSAIASRASDIQLLPTQKTIDIFFKIDGVKSFYMSIDKNISDQLSRVIRTDANMKDYTIQGPAVGKAQYKVNGMNISLRVNMLKTPMGTDINMRVLDNTIFPLTDLGLSEKILTQYRDLFAMSKGLVLVTGPTGSGKSTTLYSGLLDSGVRSRTIMSVEDPIEYVVPGVTQVEINEPEGNTFSGVTKGFLRHNPNVIVVGEIRDLEVANEAFRAAATGHLVFSTLHTNDAVSAISRILNLGLPGYTIAESLCAVVAQRLIRRVCPQCSYDYNITSADTDLIEAGLEEGLVIKRSRGCDHCRETGYHGRVAISELVTLDLHIREMLEEPNVSPTSIRRYVRDVLKVPSLLNDAVLKVRLGETTFEEIAYMFKEIV